MRKEYKNIAALAGGIVGLGALGMYFSFFDTQNNVIVKEMYDHTGDGEAEVVREGFLQGYDTNNHLEEIDWRSLSVPEGSLQGENPIIKRIILTDHRLENAHIDPKILSSDGLTTNTYKLYKNPDISTSVEEIVSRGFEPIERRKGSLVDTNSDGIYDMINWD